MDIGRYPIVFDWILAFACWDFGIQDGVFDFLFISVSCLLGIFFRLSMYLHVCLIMFAGPCLLVHFCSSILFSIVDYDTTALSAATSALPYIFPARLLDQRAGLSHEAVVNSSWSSDRRTYCHKYLFEGLLVRD